MSELRKMRSHDDFMFEKMKDRAFFDAYMNEPCPKCVALESSNARLRGALEKIAKDKVRIEYRHLDNAVYEESEMAKIAREALNDKSVGTTEGEKA